MSEKLFWLFLLLLFFPLPGLADSTCSLGEHWVASHFRRAHTRNDGVRVKATQVKGHCRENPRGYKKWHQRLSNNRPKIWGYTNEASRKWTVEEVQRFLNAISVLPDEIIGLDNVKIHRMFQSQLGQNPATTNPPQKDVTLYDLAFTHKDSLAQILSHESSHVLFESLTSTEKREFAERTGWSRKNIMGKEYYFPKKGKVSVKADSTDSLEEDFANHIELFLFKTGTVRTKSRKGYNWIQDKFGKDFKVKEGS